MMRNSLAQCICEDVIELHPAESDAQTGGTRGHQSDVAEWHGPAAVVAPVGSAPRNRGGERDAGKRPQMGAIAEALAEGRSKAQEDVLAQRRTVAALRPM